MARTLTLPAGVADAMAPTDARPTRTSAAARCWGPTGVVASTVPLPNTTEEGPRRRFLVRPGDYQQAEQAATAAGRELLGFYHSHPDHPAQPSQYDLDHAWPSFSYVIVSVMAGEPADLRSWTLREDRSAFDEESVAPVS